MPKGIPITEAQQERRRKEIANVSAHLFLEKGFNETSMREIAKAAGVGKSTLYDYFKSKEEILISYFRSETMKITDQARQIAEQEISVSEKLRRIMRLHLTYLVDNKLFYLKLTLEVQRLTMSGQQEIQTIRYAYQDMLRGLIEEGIQTGEFRPVNPLLAARSIFTLLAIAVFTSRPTGTPEEMLQDAMEIFFNGVRAGY
jgi:AcrR family transcriptional regulator